MAAILLENVPDSIHSALKERVETNNRSLDAEPLACLGDRTASRELNKTLHRPHAHYAFEGVVVGCTPSSPHMKQ